MARLRDEIFEMWAVAEIAQKSREEKQAKHPNHGQTSFSPFISPSVISIRFFSGRFQATMMLKRRFRSRLSLISKAIKKQMLAAEALRGAEALASPKRAREAEVLRRSKENAAAAGGSHENLLQMD